MAELTDIQLPDLPDDVLQQIAKHVRARGKPKLIHGCIGLDAKSTVWSLLALRDTCRAWRRVVDDVLTWHLDLAVSVNIKMASESSTTTSIHSHVTSRWGAKVVVLRDDLRTEQVGDAVIPESPPQAPESLWIIGRNEPLDAGRHIALSQVRSIAVHGERAELSRALASKQYLPCLSTVLERTAMWFRHASAMKIEVPVPVASLVAPLAVLGPTLTLLDVCVGDSEWDNVAATITLPALYELRVTFHTGKPIRNMLAAPRLQKLCVQTHLIHPDLVQTYAAQWASTLRKLDLNAAIQGNFPVSNTPDMDTAREWLWLRTLTCPAPALNLLVPTTASDEGMSPLPTLRSLHLVSEQQIGRHLHSVTPASCPAALPRMPSLTTACLDTLRLPNTIFADLATVAPRLAQLDLARSLLIKHGVPMSRAVFPALERLVVHDPEVSQAAVTAVDAPVLKHVCLHEFVTKVPWPSVTSGELVALGWIGYRPVVRRTKVWPR
ncbi:hypothetical protein AMAG_09451 [Allomyces macrogynus ATCC 38327]|uniref:Uncharacterized protein n=1 Tax=Allomyces macrogynus (strain ATCC 38327) TaxID=578462 RepID=A0A0L0SPV1_ALLM3|nr:hypothetical protein AMAG_09451 [Allomyces macrogynus ATCC 38327]|eukprot:KNE64429.1 hypothetical protein AMAG_09451 [Allomyces macrogynus ATCC 38327]